MVQQVCGVQHPVQHLAALPLARRHQLRPEGPPRDIIKIYLVILKSYHGYKLQGAADLTSARALFVKKYGPAGFLASLVQNKSQKGNKLRE